MLIEGTPFMGLHLLRNFVSQDSRGLFVKTFNTEQFRAAGLNTDWQESYYSISYGDVVRGMHLQVPPHDHEKLVYVTAGRILDVVVDLRRTSPTYHQVFSTILGPHEVTLYIPRGFAHGFLALTPEAMVVYTVAAGYQPTADVGIRWDSLNFDWPVNEPIMSARDATFPALVDFVSPF